MRDGLVFLYDFWELKSPSRYNDPDTPAADLVALIRAQTEAMSDGMGYASPFEEGMLDMLAAMSMDAGQPGKARAVLELAAEYYPLSEHVHASLLDVCARMKDLACAEKHARTADELAGGTANRERLESLLNR
jgi:hypothetical protein